MPRPRFASLDPAVKERLLRVAGEEFAAHGFEQASFNRILAEAGLSKGAVYYYFDDKEDLYATVVGEAVAIAFAAVGLVAPTRSAGEFWSEMRSLHRRGILFLREQPTAARLVRTLPGAPKKLLERGPLGEAVRGFSSFLTAYLAHGQTLGAVRRDLPLELLGAVVSAMGEAYDFWTLAHWDEAAGSEKALERTVEAATDLIRRMVAPVEKKQRRRR